MWVESGDDDCDGSEDEKRAFHESSGFESTSNDSLWLCAVDLAYVMNELLLPC